MGEKARGRDWKNLGGASRGFGAANPQPARSAGLSAP